MPGFFDNLPVSLAHQAEQLSGLIHDLREDRKAVLARHGAADEASLLAMIEAGSAPEHPAYEDYLSAQALRSAYDTAREGLQELLASGGRQ
jgi:hypothetical protein